MQRYLKYRRKKLNLFKINFYLLLLYFYFYFSNYVNRSKKNFFSFLLLSFGFTLFFSLSLGKIIYKRQKNKAKQSKACVFFERTNFKLSFVKKKKANQKRAYFNFDVTRHLWCLRRVQIKRSWEFFNNNRTEKLKIGELNEQWMNADNRNNNQKILFW